MGGACTMETASISEHRRDAFRVVSGGLVTDSVHKPALTLAAVSAFPRAHFLSVNEPPQPCFLKRVGGNLL